MANSSNRHNLPQGLVMGDEVIIEPSWSEIDDTEVEDDGEEPTLTEVMCEIKALREVCARHAKLLLALAEGGFPVITKDMLATVHEGNAVVPSAAYCPATGQFTLPPDPYQRDAVGAVTGLAPKDPEASAAPASQSVEMPGEVASPSYPPAASSL